MFLSKINLTTMKEMNLHLSVPQLSIEKWVCHSIILLYYYASLLATLYFEHFMEQCKEIIV